MMHQIINLLNEMLIDKSKTFIIEAASKSLIEITKLIKSEDVGPSVLTMVIRKLFIINK